jgi:hypothetical protein
MEENERRGSGKSNSHKWIGQCFSSRPNEGGPAPSRSGAALHPQAPGRRPARPRQRRLLRQLLHGHPSAERRERRRVGGGGRGERLSRLHRRGPDPRVRPGSPCEQWKPRAGRGVFAFPAAATLARSGTPSPSSWGSSSCAPCEFPHHSGNPWRPSCWSRR